MADQKSHLQILHALRSSINKSIDAYVALSKERSQKSKVEQARRRIWSVATSLADETVNDMQEATRLSMMVHKSFMPWVQFWANSRTSMA